MFIESDFLNRFETFIEKRKQRTRSFQQKSKNFNWKFKLLNIIEENRFFFLS